MIFFSSCKARWVVEISVLKLDDLSLQNMGTFVWFLPLLVDPDMIEHIFCSLLQFKTSYEPLVRKVDNVQGHEKCCNLKNLLLGR